MINIMISYPANLFINDDNDGNNRGMKYCINIAQWTNINILLHCNGFIIMLMFINRKEVLKWMDRFYCLLSDVYCTTVDSN